MKYMMLLVQTDGKAMEKEGPSESVMRWWGEHARAGRIIGGHQLRSASTATTVRWKGGQPVVTDGPFVEAKETIGGYGILDVPDLDAAIAIAKSWPAPQNHLVEIRPIVERG